MREVPYGEDSYTDLRCEGYAGLHFDTLSGGSKASKAERAKAGAGDFAYWNFEICEDAAGLPSKPACWDARVPSQKQGKGGRPP